MTNTTPTDAEIEAAVAHLKEVAPLIPQRNAFGDDNRAKIDLAIETLEAGYSLVDEWSDEQIDDDYDLYTAGEDAGNWLNGQYEIEDGVDFPNSWDSLVGVPQPKELRPE
jgi:hypothetical protein